MFASNLVRLRKENNLTQTDLGIELGLSKQTISNYETRDRSPNIDTLIKISRFFNVSVDYLLGESQFRNFVDEFTGAFSDIKERPDIIFETLLPLLKNDCFINILLYLNVFNSFCVLEPELDKLLDYLKITKQIN